MLVYEKETHVLRRCLFDVQNEVGLGRREEAYHRACVCWLEANGIPYQSKPHYHLTFGTTIVHTLIPDLIVWDRIIMELKAERRLLLSSDEVQLFDYLKSRGDRLGLLVNLGLDRVHAKRLVFERPVYRLTEDWNQWKPARGAERGAGLTTCRALRSLFRTHQTGYGQEVSRKLILGALVHEGLPIQAHPRAVASFGAQRVDESELDCLLIDQRIVLVSTALLDSNQLATSLGLSYMKALGMEFGVAVNMGSTELQISSLRRRPVTRPPS